jgi:MHS family proline/betaine transporter-like MFS transporter
LSFVYLEELLTLNITPLFAESHSMSTAASVLPPVSSRTEGPSRLRTISAITIGNALEFFDFTVYGFMAILIGKLFFPNLSPYNQLLLAVATFGVGFVMRPIGGVVIGAYADRAGRKAAMTLAIALMSLGCAIIAFTPTYAQIGVAAPLLMVLARLLQGFSAGGEVGASTTLLVEYASPRDRGYLASWQFASTGLGIFLGALVVSALSAALSPLAMETWGWRVPFVLGLSIAPVGIYIRRQLNETLDIDLSGATRRHRNSSLRILLKEHRRSLAAGILTVMGSTTAAYVVTFYMPSYAVRELGLSPAFSLAAAALVGFLSFALASPVGWLSDRIGRKSLIIGSRVVLALVIYPAFVWLVDEPSPGRLLTLMALLGALHVVQAVPGLTALPEMFPKHVRATGMSVVYSVGVALFGGFSPLIVTWMVNETGSKLAPAWYLMGTTVVSLFGLLLFKDQTGQAIDPD